MDISGIPLEKAPALILGKGVCFDAQAQPLKLVMLSLCILLKLFGHKGLLQYLQNEITHYLPENLFSLR